MFGTEANILFSAALILTVPLTASAMDKEELLAKYKGKVVVVMNEGLSTALCGSVSDTSSNYLNIDDRGEITLKPFGTCGFEPMHRGEVLKVSRVSLQLGNLFLGLQNVSPHSTTRGIGVLA